MLRSYKLWQAVLKLKIRHVGLSDDSTWGINIYLKLAEKHDLPRMVSIQNELACYTKDWPYLIENCVHEDVAASYRGHLWRPVCLVANTLMVQGRKAAVGLTCSAKAFSVILNWLMKQLVARSGKSLMNSRRVSSPLAWCNQVMALLNYYWCNFNWRNNSKRT